ncbi:hypothetical protein [Alicyclobacillus herbarius]|uniref:hypothetical protein n=1 Tax=Alicyclobacillus herbarius TaxID=122960 RepID=UPI0012DEE74F|nr:hypothetical protein [Alicyclobacillus herbarius]
MKTPDTEHDQSDVWDVMPYIGSLVDVIQSVSGLRLQIRMQISTILDVDPVVRIRLKQSILGQLRV